MMNQNPVQESIRQRLTITLFVGQSLFAAAMIATFTLMAIVAADLSGSDAMAGIPSTLTLLGRAVAAYPIGLLLDKAGRRMGLSAGFGLGVVGSIMAVYAISIGSFAVFCVGAVLMGMGRAGSDQSRYIAAEIHVADKRAKVIGLLVFAGTIGAVIGPALVAPSQSFALANGFAAVTGPFLVGIGLYALGLLVTMLFLRPDPKEISAAIEIEEQQLFIQAPARPLITIFRQPAIILSVAALSISQLVMAMLMVITPLYMNHHAHGASSISFVISAHTFGMFALSGVTGWLIDHYGRVPLIVAGAFVLILASILTPLSTAVMPLAVALFLLGLGWNFCFIAGSSLLSDSLAANERPRTQGASEMLVALAAGIAGLATGVLFDQAGMTAVSTVGFLFSASLLGFVAFYALSSRPWVRQPEAIQ
ncbi:MAG: MFS transporter [Chloroflexi bacterium]|nr:MFS transporter [Ardenticatenaceae bacterium]MBL1128360.1 MFS transporter [Chloroflexota bacterium]NOG34435.1 MFS transporter [Chloroflexota bacterium]GIK57676.1 MAG: MFS transporter [Chloroflexota bacterium]